MHNTNKKTRSKFIAWTLGVALLGAVFGMALSTDLGTQNAATAENLTAMTMQASTASDLESPFKSVYNEVSQSVVGIQLNTQRRSMNGRITANSSFVGSGVVISDDGYVVTNYHVVTGGSNEVVEDISVVYDDKEYPAKYVAGDEETDIAVLQVNGLEAPAARLGNSDELSVGDWALVVGNPLGDQFTNTLTVGVVSGLNRDMSSGRMTSQTSMIQTDAAINSGNSGGGMFNIRGELIGITSMKMSNNGLWGSASIESIGFAIPINTVTKIADDLIDHGAVIYPRMGVSITTMDTPSDEPTKEYLPKSVWIRAIEEGTPAEEVGLQVNDLIMKADGERVTTVEELQKIVRSHQIGESVELEVYRIPNVASIREDEDIPEGEYLTFNVELKALDN